MDTGRWKALRTLFETACDLPDGERTKFIEKTRADDPELGAELDRLVATDKAGSDDLVSRGAPYEILARDLDLAGKNLGSFKILRELGRGGMGQVWVAEQHSPKRRVALKTLKGGIGSDRTRRRFILESELLARLRHPGIATVYEAGTFSDPISEQATPWFAMELVEDAQIISRFVQNRDLGPKKIVELFLQVCDAVQYGHQHGVIHRDLKPQNVLVDGQGSVKVIDFGVARALDEDDAMTFSRTLDGQLLGTPDYMSPEQLESGASSADTRSDVWALGVMLYELLTGQRPYDLGDEPLTRAAQALAERRFEKPSMVERSDGRSIAKELDWILMRSIEREPERRYSSAGELAAELRRYLRGQAILAGPPGVGYLLTMFARRNRVPLTIAGASLVALVGILTWQSWSARSARWTAAESALEDAEQKIAAFGAQLDRTLEREARVLALKDMMQRRYLTVAERKELDEEGDRVLLVRRQRDGVAYEVLELLARAERLAPEIQGIEDARAELWMAKWREAMRTLDAASLREKRIVQLRRDLELASEFTKTYDVRGRFRDELAALGDFVLRRDPADSEVHLFRMVNGSKYGLEPRLVAMPHSASGPDHGQAIAPDSFVLRVCRHRGDLRDTDVVFEVAGFPIRDVLLVESRDRSTRARLERLGQRRVHDLWEWREWSKTAEPDLPVVLRDARGEPTALSFADFQRGGYVVRTPLQVAQRGGIPVRMVSDGEIRSVTMPAGVPLRLSAKPVMPCAASRFDIPNPFEGKLPEGLYMFLLRKQGYESQRFVVRVNTVADQGGDIVLHESGTSPPEFVSIAQNSIDPYWILDREVRTDEYLEFLNDPATRAEVDASSRPIRFPRYTHNENQGGYWKRVDGLWKPPEHWRGDWPALGVSYEDAVAYIAWYQRREEAAGRTEFVYTIPTMGQWMMASETSSIYVFGDQFRPQWVKSCFSRKRPCPEPGLNYPIDESHLGVFDLSGSAFEWLDSWFWKERRLRNYAAGSWAMANPDLFSYIRSQGATESSSWDTYGFRMVAKRRKK